jgi:hypothetical protein
MKPFHYNQDPLYNAAASILQGKQFEAEQPEHEPLSEAVMTNDILKKVLRVLETQGFSNWYNNEFEDYISGEDDAKTQEEILDDLAKLMLF